MTIEYDMPLYRPPSEARSLIIQVTLGCSHNECSFCSMYKMKKFKIKSLDIIKSEIDIFRSYYSYVDKIFLADGDALMIPMNTLREILKYINKVFPERKQITLYASPKSIFLKTDEELKELKSLGIKMAYMGIESGSDRVLEAMNKGATYTQLVMAGQKIKNSGILLSATVIAGLGGRENSQQHAINTGKIISVISPDYLGVLSLMIEKNTSLYKWVKDGEFEVLQDREVLEEIREMIKNIDVQSNVIFRSNHASNYVNLKGTLPNDKNSLINEINYYLNHFKFKSEEYRRL